jgi:hypothetical protein
MPACQCWHFCFSKKCQFFSIGTLSEKTGMEKLNNKHQNLKKYGFKH